MKISINHCDNDDGGIFKMTMMIEIMVLKMMLIMMMVFLSNISGSCMRGRCQQKLSNCWPRHLGGMGELIKHLEYLHLLQR